MLCPGVTQEWVDEGELPRERTKNWRWQRPYDVRSTSVNNAMARRTVDSRSECHGAVEAGLLCVRIEASSDESLGHQHMGAVYHRRRSQIVSTSESHGGNLIIQRCKAIDSRAMGLAAPWYHRDETFVKSSIPCSYGGRALVVKGAEEVENAKANSKNQDKAEG
ncbi:hypothetical protein B296_00028021 [Ensete ventricosum]|uniref:Uncharacterized protein n=1 Tax=Ensete ventricosum TaxID=4639 RepID=A0A426WZ61_ENSVE|nr:hypothetical protein B296_00028021 [Ensete ventricosum]